jgi:steroid 5-alpha reductase family enzyme
MFYVLLAVSAVITAAGFYKFVYFLSTGYAFSVAALAVAMMIGYGTSLTLPVFILHVFIALYAARLGVFLVIREYKSGAYRKVLDEASSGYKKNPLFVKLFIWKFCSILYVIQMSPLFFRRKNGLQEAHTGWLYAGIILVAAGLIIQAVADAQKNRVKQQNPKVFADRDFSGLYAAPTISAKFLSGPGSLSHQYLVYQDGSRLPFHLQDTSA